MQNHTLQIEKLSDELTPDQLPHSLFQRPYFFLLESSLPGKQARYSIAAWNPVTVLEVRDRSQDPFHFLKENIRQAETGPYSHFPFTGGWVGYLGYETYSSLETKCPPREPVLIPRAVWGYYDQFYLYDHEKREAFWITRNDSELGEIPAAPSLFEKGGSRGIFQSNFSKDNYLNAIHRIQNYITAGDCYQVNLSQKFSAPITSSAYEIYRRLRQVSPAPYSAYLNLGGAQILSSSPECFLEVNQRKVITRPIKGTRPRGKAPLEDADLKEELSTSPKDHAELLMITDLERNDLGRVCKPGSVRVSQLGSVETFPQVHHLVSTIEGELAQGKDTIDLLKATFPGGSITGAPKVRAMQIIRELEPHAREVYCGAIGFLSNNGKAEFNIAIRTMVIKEGQAHFWSGGGIVADSDPEKEYEETLVKAEGLIKSL